MPTVYILVYVLSYFVVAYDPAVVQTWIEEEEKLIQEKNCKWFIFSYCMVR